MSVQVTFPGVYGPEPVEPAAPIVGTPTSIAGFIGYLRRGPIDTAVRITAFDDFDRIFGGLDEASDTSYQVFQFFRNGGTDCYVIRCVDGAQPPALARAALPRGHIAGPGQPGLAIETTTLELTAANPGTWGQDLYLTVDYMTPPGSGSFNLQVALYDLERSDVPTRSLRLPRVTLDGRSSLMRAILALDDGLIAMDPTSDGPEAPPPLPSGTLLRFVPSAQPRQDLTLTVSVAFPPAPGQTPPSPVTTAVGHIADLSGCVSALRTALAAAGDQMGLPALGDAVIHLFSSPFAPEPTAVPDLIQVLLTDPRQASTLVSVVCSQPELIIQLRADVHAVAMTLPDPTVDASPPDGAPPRTIDLAGGPSSDTGVTGFRRIDTLNLICAPDLRRMSLADYEASAGVLLDYAQDRRAFVILDPHTTLDSVPIAESWATIAPTRLGANIINAAVYFPDVLITDPIGDRPRRIGPCGTMAGVYARGDVPRGVWSPPAGASATLDGVDALDLTLTDRDCEFLGFQGLNPLRSLEHYGLVAWGARNLAAGDPSDAGLHNVGVRRLALHIQDSVLQGLRWTVFEPNGPALWAKIQSSVAAFMQTLWAQGAFFGATAAEAYEVRCDHSTTTPMDIDALTLNIQVSFAPTYPSEFIQLHFRLRASQPSPASP